MSSPELYVLPSLSFLAKTEEESGWNKSTEGCSLGCGVVDTPLIQLGAAAPPDTHRPPYRVKKQKGLGWLTPTHNVYLV